MTTVKLLNHEPPYDIKFVPDSKTDEIQELIAKGYENLGPNRSPPPTSLKHQYNYHPITTTTKLTSDNMGGSRRRARRPSRKYKKSAKRVFRKKSRSTRRR